MSTTTLDSLGFSETLAERTRALFQMPDIAESEALATSGQLPEPRLLAAARATLLAASLLVFAFIGWAAVVHVKEMASANGNVVPSGYVQTVQHLEGGIIEKIHVHEGDRVSKDQPLVTLEGAAARKDMEELKSRQLSLKLQAERLRAFIEKRKPDFSFGQGVNSAFVADQERILLGMNEAMKREAEVIRTQVRQKKESLSTLQAELKTTRANLGIAAENHGIQEKLMSQGLTTRMRLLERQEKLNSFQGQESQLLSEIQGAKEAISEYNARLASLDARYHDEAYRQLGEVEATILQNAEALAKYEDRVQRLEIRSPVEGFVKGLEINTVGGVIGAGQKIMEIVPEGRELVVDARIQPSDIGHVRAGQPVQVRVQAYDFTRYGSIPGTLESISATTFVDEAGRNYYRGRIRLLRNYAGQDSSRNFVLPGMTVDADIETGEKSILSYLMKPIHVAISNALHER